MKLQRGNFTIKNIDELDQLEENNQGLKKVIDLCYMGSFEYEGNTIPVSRMYIEMQKDDYYFYPINKFDVNGNQMFYYFNSKLLDGKDASFLEHVATGDIDRNYSLWEYMNHPEREYVCNFWWNIESDYFVFFGEEKKDVVNYFIDSCYERDGKVEGIQKSLRKAGYKV